MIGRAVAARRSEEPTMVFEITGLFAAGLGFWTLLEYAIHGGLSHRWKTFVSPLHWSHHKVPANVFTSPIAVAAIALLLLGAAALVAGPLRAATFVAGAFAGFCHYEWLHWRFHFRTPRTARERLLRAHHLAHHFCNPRFNFGVSTRFWDRAFGTLSPDWKREYARVSDREPIDGTSNFREIWNPKTCLAHFRRAARNAR